MMRGKVRMISGEDDIDLTDIAVDLLLNQSWWEIMDKFPFREKERTLRFDMVVGKRDYLVPQPFEAIQTISIISTSENSEEGKHSRLERMTPEWYETQFDETAGTTPPRGTPEKYMRRENGMIVFPSPDLAYEAVIYYLTTLADLEEGVVDTPVVPQVWHEIIYFGGGWRRLLELGDFVRAREIKNHQVTLINSTSPVEAKEEGDTHLGGVELPRELTEI